MITGRQIRAARALLDISQDELATSAGLTKQGISKIEDGSVQPREGTITDILRVFTDRGIEFTENEGVRRRPEGIEIFEGAERYVDFFSFMYTYLERFGGTVCISVKDERFLQKYVKNIEYHRAKMSELVAAGKVTGRILAVEGNFKRGWADLRRQGHTQDMPQVSFFAFGDNFALISFDRDPSPYIVLHKASPFAAAYRTAFDAAWEKAEIIT